MARESPQVARQKIRASQGAMLQGWLDDLGGLDFRAFIERRAFPGFVWLYFRELIVKRIQDFIDGKLLLPNGDRADKLFIALRTQTGKSTIVQLLASHLLLKYAGLIIGSAMHSDDLVMRFSKMVRSFVLNAGGRLTSSAIHDWFVDNGSEFWAKTKGSRPSGMPAHVILGDDLLGGALDAESSNVASKDIEWLSSEFLKRKAPIHPELGRFLQISIGTRWSTSDVQAYWLSLGGWYCLVIPTIFEPDTWPIGVPVGPFDLEDSPDAQKTQPWEAPNCTIEPDWRQPGEALEPTVEEFSAAAFHASRRINGGPLSEARISSIEQGCPKPAAGGGILYRSWFTPLTDLPATKERSVRAWDFGASVGGGDPTASCRMDLVDSLNVIYHGCRAWLGAGGVLQLVAAMMLLDGLETTVVVPVALADAGKISLAGIKRYLQQVAGWAGVSCSAIRGQSVRTRGKPANFRSAKHHRVAYPGGSLAESAQPADWEGPHKPFTVPGDVAIVMAEWRPSLRDLAPGFAERAVEHPELLEIEKLARACTGQATPAEMKALNVDPLGHQGEMLSEAHDFSGHDGGRDNYLDAMADAKTVLSGQHFGRPMTL